MDEQTKQQIEKHIAEEADIVRLALIAGTPEGVVRKAKKNCFLDMGFPANVAEGLSEMVMHKALSGFSFTKTDTQNLRDFVYKMAQNSL